MIPEAPAPATPTSHADIDAMLERLSSKKNAWTEVTIEKRIEYLERALDGLGAVAEEWVTGGAALKGLDENDPQVGEEWLAGPVTTARNVRLFIEALRAGGAPKASRVTTRDDGRTIARVSPRSMLDRATLGGVTCDVWIEPGKPASQGAIYAKDANDANAKKSEGRVCLVLGAGNVSSIPPMDALHKLFAEDQVVLLKMNPVNEHIGPRIARAFQALVDDGYLAVCYGAADTGAYCARHATVDTLHVTGSDRTYDAIVWGSSEEERARRKAANDPIDTRPFTAELGCVTPVIVVPGPWSIRDLRFQAQHVAAMVTQNASFNCNAAKVLMLARGWLQRETFLDELHTALAKAPARKAYYPGAEKRYEDFLTAYPHAIVRGQLDEGAIPWTTISDVAPTKGEYALTHEAFCGVLAEVTLDLSETVEGIRRDAVTVDPARFLDHAVAVANDRCWGTLSCAILVHPETERTYAAALDRAIAKLRYGGIGINCWPGLIYGLVVPPWGAFPGHTREDIRSGTGFVHNAMMYDHPEKAVVRAPFRMRPKPVYFSSHKTLATLGRQVFDLERGPTLGKLLRVAATAIRG